MHKRVIGTVILLILLFTLVLPIHTAAVTYDVSAQVHAPLPPSNDPPVVQTPDNNSTLQVQNVFVTGTCYIIDPSLIVVLIRNNQIVGSGPCLPDGTFRILVGLVQGVNVLTPKHLTITGQFGDLGLPITLIYNNPSLPNKQEQPQTNQQSGLELKLGYDFITYTDTSPTEVTYTITGGTKPYKVTINWGDGTQTTSKINSNDLQTSRHQYDRVLPPASLTVTVVDANGDKVVQSRALVSFRKGVYVPAAQPLSNKNNLLPWLIISMLSICLLLVSHYTKKPQQRPNIARKTNKTTKKGTKR